MESRLVIIILGLCALTTAEEKQCHACVDNICYDIQNVTDNYYEYDRLTIYRENYVIDRVDNLVYFVESLHSLEIRTFNLTDKATKTVLTVTQTFRSIAFNESSRDLYYSLIDGDVFKYNLLTNKTVSILKPVNVDFKRPKVDNLVILSNKLFAMMNVDIDDDYRPRMVEYVPEESQFKTFAPLKDVVLNDVPIADLRGDIYFKTYDRLFKLRVSTNSIDLVHKDWRFSGLNNIGAIDIYGTDNHGVAYFMPENDQRLYRLAPYSDDLILFGSIDTYAIKSINFDKYNNLIYIQYGLRYLTASSKKCELRLLGRYGIEIVKLTD